MTQKEVAKLREWAVKKAAMFEMKTIEHAHQYSAMENLKRYEMVIELCDMFSERCDKK